MKIGIIGVGVVGETILKGYNTLGHECTGYDKYKRPYKKTWKNLMKTKAIFVCLPTVQGKNGLMNLECFDETFERLNKNKYKGLIIIKSTVIPGTTRKLSEQYDDLAICHSPEFLTEKNAMVDFFKPDRIIFGYGDLSYKHEDSFEELHSQFNAELFYVTAETSEFAKFMSNAFFATKVVFANEMAEIAEIYGADYEDAKDILIKDRRVGNGHLDINEEKAYGGMCLPKDIHQLLVDLVINHNVGACQLISTEVINERKTKLKEVEQ